MNRYQLFVVAVAVSLVTPAISIAKPAPEGVWVRPGYTLTVVQDEIKRPRFLETAPDGTLFVSLPNAGEIKACRDKDNDGYYETVTTFVSEYPTAHGLCWYEGWLWFTQTGAILKARDTNNDGKADEVVKVVKEDQVPSEGGGHWWRALLVYNDTIYTSIGDQTNATDEEIDASERRKIWTFDLNGKNKQLFCSGVRNTEKYCVRPGTDEIWGVDHDIDNIAKSIEDKAKKLDPANDWGQPITDVYAPGEFNHYRKGEFYGHPFIVGNKLPNFNFLNRPDIVELAAKTVAPEWCMKAHCAGNGMTFYDAKQFPGHYGDAFVAQRGSWNNAVEKVGYRIVRILFEDGHPYGELDYVRFLTPEQEVLGRPVDCTVAGDGTLLFSDDTKNRIYRLKYTGE